MGKCIVCVWHHISPTQSALFENMYCPLSPISFLIFFSNIFLGLFCFCLSCVIQTLSDSQPVLPFIIVKPHFTDFKHIFFNNFSSFFLNHFYQQHTESALPHVQMQICSERRQFCGGLFFFKWRKSIDTKWILREKDKKNFIHRFLVLKRNKDDINNNNKWWKIHGCLKTENLSVLSCYYISSR